MGEDVGVVAAGVFEGVGEDRQGVDTRARRRSPQECQRARFTICSVFKIELTHTDRNENTENVTRTRWHCSSLFILPSRYSISDGVDGRVSYRIRDSI